MNLDGWNDPPANLVFSDNMSTKRVLLNKRVPYTNQDLTSTKNVSGVLTAPPSCPSPNSLDSGSLVDTTISPITNILTIEEIYEIFKKQMKKLEDSSSIEKRVVEDINRKFQVMNEDWCQDKLTLNTKQGLSNMFRALDADQIQKAFDMHLQLVRNASSEVVRFMVGIKRLIQELQRISN